MTSFGIKKGPAVVIVNYKLKSEVSVPSLDVNKRVDQRDIVVHSGLLFTLVFHY